MKKTHLKMDHVFKDYFKNKKHFADLMNAALFHGRPLIKAKYLHYYDTDMTTVDDQKYMSHEKRRDVFMVYYTRNKIYLFGIENQSRKDDLMPIRDLMYAAFCHSQRLRQHELAVHIVTVVLYCGDKPWSGMMCMKEFIDSQDDFIHLQGEFDEEFDAEEMEKYLNDWKVMVVDLARMNKELLHDRENYLLVECVQAYVQHGNDINCLKGKVLPKNVAIVMASVVRNDSLFYLIELEESEEIDMNEKFNELMNKTLLQGIMKGRQEGIIEGEHKGQLNGKRQTLLKLLNELFGSLSKETQITIENSTENQIDIVITHIFDIKSEEDVIGLLN